MDPKDIHVPFPRTYKYATFLHHKGGLMLQMDLSLLIS